MPRHNTRVTSGIFSNETHPAEDADVIMTAAVVGFCIKLLSEGKPVRFDTEGIHAGMSAAELAEDAPVRRQIAQMAGVVASINRVVSHIGLPGSVQQGTSPAYDYRDKLIFGVEDGDRREFFDRNLEQVFTEEAQTLHDLAVNDPTLSYQGRGAYTGFVVSPEGGGKPAIMSPYCSIIPDEAALGQRWHPGPAPASLGTEPEQKTWGMIGTNRTQKTLSREGMGFVPTELADSINAWSPDAVPPQPWTGTHPGTDIVGYTHGMIEALVKCLIRGRDGSRPYEIAVGTQTTKLASCFCCATLMYASRFAPSSIHLDSNESWVPMYGEHFSLPVGAIVETTEAWYQFCTESVTTGLSALRQSMHLVHEDHHHSLLALHAFLGDHTARTTCANLILDAVTVHDKERLRIGRTLR